MTEQEIRDLFAGFNVPLPKDDIWRVQGNPVVKHQALERLAAAMKVEWTEVQFIHITDRAAVIMVRGKRTDGIIAHEWSTGEAVIGQNYQVSGKQAAYPVAMAEKRAKDRVILKLARLYGVYSEDEADEFAEAAPKAAAAVQAVPQALADEMIAFVASRASEERLDRFLNTDKFNADWDRLDGADQDRVRKAIDVRREELRRAA